MRRYEKYRKIGLPWLDYIPYHWQALRNKNVFIEQKEVVGTNSSDYTLLSLTLKGIIPRNIEAGGKFPASFENYKVVKNNDLVFCLFDIDETPRTVGLSSYDGMLTGAYTVMSIKNINPQYIYFYYLALDNRKMLKPLYKGLRKTISIDTFQSMKIPVPPRAEQDQIVRFLDWKVSEINKLIGIKKKAISELAELRKIFVNKIVTHGLKSDTLMKFSGVKSIGFIPKNWNVYRCKYLFIERDERSIDGKEHHLSMSQKHGLVMDSCLDERRMFSESYIGGKICHKGDLVLNRLKAHLGVFSLATAKGVISPDYTVLVPKTEKVIPAYAEMVLKSEKFRKELRIRVKGVTEGFWRLYTDDFYTISLPVPPIEEQRLIIKRFKSYEETIEMYVSSIGKEVELLNELKNTIISDVVTGKIDVRNIAIPAYEHVEDAADAGDGEEIAEELAEETEA